MAVSSRAPVKRESAVRPPKESSKPCWEADLVFIVWNGQGRNAVMQHLEHESFLFALSLSSAVVGVKRKRKKDLVGEN